MRLKPEPAVARKIASEALAVLPAPHRHALSGAAETRLAFWKPRHGGGDYARCRMCPREAHPSRPEWHPRLRGVPPSLGRIQQEIVPVSGITADMSASRFAMVWMSIVLDQRRPWIPTLPGNGCSLRLVRLARSRTEGSNGDLERSVRPCRHESRTCQLPAVEDAPDHFAGKPFESKLIF